jgi:hypothetical protein
VWITYQDAVQHVLDYLGGGVGDAVMRDSRRAVSEAYRELATSHHWSYLYTHGRINTNAPFQDGTIAYQHTGGTYERMVTLTGGTWPDFAALTYIRVGVVGYRVVERKSATVVTLDEQVNPGADIAALTQYIMYQDTYVLPADFRAQDQALYESNFGGMQYCHPKEWLYENRYIFQEGIPQQYTITGDNRVPGRLVIRLLPWPILSRSIDFIYQRSPRDMTVGWVDGTASVSADSNSISCPGPGFFTPNMVGSVLRLSATSTKPTGDIGGAAGYNPAAFESVIQSYVSPTSVLTFDASNNALSGVAATASDPIEIERESMANCFLRCCEKHIGMSRVLKDKPSARAQFVEELEKARAADSRSFMGRACGPAYRYRMKLRDMPMGPDES